MKGGPEAERQVGRSSERLARDPGLGTEGVDDALGRCLGGVLSSSSTGTPAQEVDHRQVGPGGTWQDLEACMCHGVKVHRTS